MDGLKVAGRGLLMSPLNFQQERPVRIDGRPELD